MSYDVQLVRLQPQPVVYTYRRVPIGQIGEAIGPAFGAVWQFAAEHGLQMAGPPYARYLAPPTDTVEFEAGMPVVSIVPGEGGIQTGELPGGDAAVCIHTGPFDQVRGAYEAMEAWMRAEGRSPGGPPWEVYLTEPEAEPDQSKWQTQVVWPLA